jgi:hypothetical protein
MRTLSSVMGVLLAASAWGSNAGSPGYGEGRRVTSRVAERKLVVQAQRRESEFTEAVEALRAASPDDPEAQPAMERALKLLDGAVAASLGAGSGVSLEAVNQNLAGYITREPAAGEGYRLYRVGQAPDVYALSANFGSSGPSAVRIYARTSPGGPYQLAGRIDRYAQKDYFDDYLELLPVDAQSAVFVTVTGRTDELQSGSFALWQYNGKEVAALWSSDLLPLSRYEVVPRGLVITYCADLEGQNQQTCRKTVREKYQWNGQTWKQESQEEVAPGR